MRTLICIIIIPFIFGCSNDSYENLNFKEFNSKVEYENSNNSEWVKSPIMVSLFFIGTQLDYLKTDIHISSLDKGEAINNVFIEIESESLLDDSIAGNKFEMILTKHIDGFWMITSAKKKCKCKSGRGHSYYSNAPCD